VLANARRSASEGFDLRLRTTLRQISEKELGFAVNFSTGVAVMRDGDTTLTGLLARADVALYTAKHEGRGRLVQSEGGLGQTVI
jgi:diguanylate cyclase